MQITALPARTFKPRRSRPGSGVAWSGHLPFASDLIAALKPSVLVELGTHYGESYFGMCQAVQEHAVSCMCYAVDTWKGDNHTLSYDESVFDEVNRYNEQNYLSFSKLLRTTFDAARENFGDETVDLLHIDGLHTYDAIRHDFDTWFPTVRPGGVVLLHDTVARHGDFGVWKIWEELAGQFPHVEFTHSWGLGVLRKPGGSARDSEFLQAVFGGSPSEQGFLRHYYALEAEVLERTRPAAPLSSSDRGEVHFTVYPSLPNGYSEDTSVAVPLKTGQWQDVVLDLSHGVGSGRLRVDPADSPCLVNLASVQLRRKLDGSVVRSWTDAADIREFSPISDLELLPGGDGAQFLSTGSDPQFLLPEVDRALAGQPLIFEARVRIEGDFVAAMTLLRSTAAALTDGGIERTKATARRDAALALNAQLSAEVRNLQAERVAVVADYRRVHGVNESLLNETASLKSRMASEQERWLQEEAALKAELRIIYQSRSWGLTAPLRRLFRALR